MNREILFRGKRIDNEKCVYGYYIRLDSHDAALHIIVDEHGEYHRIDPKTLGRYTGKDLNEEKLFVGDIVESYEDYDDMWGDSKTGYARSVVVWDKDNFCYAFNTDGYIQPFNDWNWENSAKIGNIHDDPELLEGETND